MPWTPRLFQRAEPMQTPPAELLTKAKAAFEQGFDTRNEHAQALFARGVDLIKQASACGDVGQEARDYFISDIMDQHLHMGTSIINEPMRTQHEIFCQLVDSATRRFTSSPRAFVDITPGSDVVDAQGAISRGKSNV